MLEKLEVAKSMLHGFDRSPCRTQPTAQEHILNQQDGNKRYVKMIVDPSKTFALRTASDQAMQAALAKRSGPTDRSPEGIDAVEPLERLLKNELATRPARAPSKSKS